MIKLMTLLNEVKRSKYVSSYLKLQKEYDVLDDILSQSRFDIEDSDGDIKYTSNEWKKMQSKRDKIHDKQSNLESNISKEEFDEYIAFPVYMGTLEYHQWTIVD